MRSKGVVFKMNKRKLLIINKLFVIIGLTLFIVLYFTTGNKMLALLFLIATQIIHLILGFIIGDK